MDADLTADLEPIRSMWILPPDAGDSYCFFYRKKMFGNLGISCGHGRTRTFFCWFSPQPTLLGGVSASFSGKVSCAQWDWNWKVFFTLVSSGSCESSLSIMEPL